VARVRGAFFSIDAWGNFGDILVYQRRRGGGVVFPYTVSRNPNSDGQQEQRTSFQAATSSWGALPPQSRAWWQVRAQGTHLSGYNLYVQNYLLGLIDEGGEG
jgi:hypothetical protein